MGYDEMEADDLPWSKMNLTSLDCGEKPANLENP